jgi:hypothetical protein
VLYLSDEETETLNIPYSELWRVVRFEVTKDNWISWIHEREWRSKGNFKLPRRIPAAFVKTTTEAEKLSKKVAKATEKKPWACTPLSVIPLEVLCQGLIKRS